ncbi:MAG: DUF2961 domain-containing protein [bacterium]
MRKLVHIASGPAAGMVIGSGLAFGAVATGAIDEKSVVKSPAVAWESLPSIRTGVKIWSHTSKSALNCTVMDWTNYTLQDTNGYEQAFVKGYSGMLVHAWFAWLGKAGGTLNLFLKDDRQADYGLPFTDYFKSGQYPHQLWRSQDGMWWTFPCLPFDSVFKAAINRRPDWYQYTLHIYRERRFSESIAREDVEALQVRMNAPVGTFPGTDAGNQARSHTMNLGVSESGVVFEAGKSGVIRSIRIALPSDVTGVMDAVHIRMTTDGAVTADLPVSMFFGGYRGADMKNAKGLPAGYDGTKLYSFFPMPFWKSMKIELVNKHDKPVRAVCEIGWSDHNPYSREMTGVFKVQFNDSVSVKTGEPDFANLDVEGAGVLVGCVSKLTGDIEGNFSIFIDGSRTPAIETTGGEDYFNHSYGIHPGFSTAFSGGLAEQTGYRFHIIDYVPFLNSIKLTQDHAQRFTHDRDGTFLSAVYYYHTPKKFLELTDSIDIGKHESELAHNYRVDGTEGRMRLQTDTAAYEGNFNELFTDDGRWTDKGSSFTVKINPDNDGVRLRRRINQMSYHQEMEVYVDGKLAGTWFEQGGNFVLNYDHRKYKIWVEEHFVQQKQDVPTWQAGTMPSKFRDTEFEIPAALTKGRKTLDVKMVTKGALAVTPGDEGLTNEYYYWVYSHAGKI